MRPVSARFLRTVRGSHEVVCEARVVSPGQTGVNPTGTLLSLLDGDVEIDGTADIRSTIDITINGRGMWPTQASSLLTPYGNEIHVRRGIRYGNGTTEWVSLGYHRINTPAQEQAPDGPIRVAATDRMWGLIKGRLVNPIQFGPTATLGFIVSTLVREVYPSAVIEWDDNTSLIPLSRSLTAEEERFEFLADLVQSAGKIWYWDHRGVLVIRKPPQTTNPAFTVSHGADGVLVELSRELTDEEVYNGVVATGEAADTAYPARAVVVDTNPQSPTRWGGPFGKVPRFYSSPFLYTDTQAQAAAAAMLTRSLGLPYSVDFSMVPNPALEPYDPILVTYPGRSETHVIERLTVPLTASEPMTASTREQTLIALGVI
ncbi:DUF5047 domain-containing protein [Micromonospora sp. NPDC006766]|uniref:DUF5047 domain-containing protein n=1 Tax=Micromonospora sp. NPDC006766 TaxID=3154778 RepID=UPI0033C8E0F8